MLGTAAHLALGVPYAFSGLLAPVEGVAILWAIWVALLVIAVSSWTTRPLLAAAVPLATIALWFAVLGIGSLVFGWTA
jgi:hypothetical protein